MLGGELGGKANSFSDADFGGEIVCSCVQFVISDNGVTFIQLYAYWHRVDFDFDFDFAII